jgi:hypothetical protein
MQTIRRPVVSFAGVLLLGLVIAVAIAVAGSPGLAWLGFAFGAVCAQVPRPPRRSRR